MSEPICELDFDELMAECDLSDYAERRIGQIEEIADARDSGLTALDGEFLVSLVRHLASSYLLTIKQQSKLNGIYKRCVG